MIKFKHKGDFRHLEAFLKTTPSQKIDSIIRQYAEQGLVALRQATPVNTGLLADSWSYDISYEKNRISLNFINNDIENGCPIAIIVQYGHATKNGGWVTGIDYINPAIQSLFINLADSAWREVIKVQ